MITRITSTVEPIDLITECSKRKKEIKKITDIFFKCGIYRSGNPMAMIGDNIMFQFITYQNNKFWTHATIVFSIRDGVEWSVGDYTSETISVDSVEEILNKIALDRKE